MRVAQQFINRDPGVRKADQKPARRPHEVFDFAETPGTGLGEPRQGTHLSMLRTTHPRRSEGASLRGDAALTLSPSGRGIWGEGRKSAIP